MTKNKSLLVTLLAAATLLAGCFEPRTEWVKEGAGTDELRYARQECERTSAGYAFVDDSRYEDSRRDQGRLSSARSDSYRKCMEAQGWHRQRADQSATTR
jgi:hypothetical protein